MKVQNLLTSKGNAAANQFEITLDDGVVFQSYDSLIACKLNTGDILLSHKWDYSVTTLKYLKVFLNDNRTASQFRDAISCGEFQLVKEGHLKVLVGVL